MTLKPLGIHVIDIAKMCYCLHMEYIYEMQKGNRQLGLADVGG